MWVICYTYDNGVNDWEMIDGEDAMQQRVCELEELYDLSSEDIMVFNVDDMLPF